MVSTVVFSVNRWSLLHMPWRRWPSPAASPKSFKRWKNLSRCCRSRRGIRFPWDFESCSIEKYIQICLYGSNMIQFYGSKYIPMDPNILELILIVGSAGLLDPRCHRRVGLKAIEWGPAASEIYSLCFFEHVHGCVKTSVWKSFCV